jgi:translation initiation factor 1
METAFFAPDLSALDKRFVSATPEMPKGKIHLRFTKTGPRAVTVIQGLDEDLDQHRIAKAMKKKFNCATTVQKDKDGSEIIQLQGDQRIAIRQWLVRKQILTQKESDERLVLHGF